MKIPTPVRTIVDNAKAKIAKRSLKWPTIFDAITLAAPDSIITPASTPAAITRIMVPMTPELPFTIASVVWDKFIPPTKQPTIAPKIKAYTGLTLNKINPIAKSKPNKAAHHAITIYKLRPSSN